MRTHWRRLDVCPSTCRRGRSTPLLLDEGKDLVHTHVFTELGGCWRRGPSRSPRGLSLQLLQRVQVSLDQAAEADVVFGGMCSFFGGVFVLCFCWISSVKYIFAVLLWWVASETDQQKHIYFRLPLAFPAWWLASGTEQKSLRLPS